MKAYIVFRVMERGDYEEYVEKVFDSEEKAEKYIDENYNENDLRYFSRRIDIFKVE